MGNNTLSTVIGGIGRPTQVNQYKEALSGDILPRNADGEVEALAANLGSQAVPFKELHATVINKGATRKKKEFLTAGSHTFTVPEGVNEVKVILAGGGSGVAKTINSGLAVGCGGGCGEATLMVAGGDILSISAGAGGAIASAAITLGGKGGDSSLSVNGVAALSAGINRQIAVDKPFFVVQNSAISLFSSDMSDSESYSPSGRSNCPPTSSGYSVAVSGQGGPSFKAGSIFGTGGAGGGIVAAIDSTGANGGAIIYYDLPSWSTDPNNGVDA